MAKTITTKKYQQGDIGAKLVGKNSKEKSDTKAKELSKVTITDFTKDGIDVVIVNSPSESSGILSISVNAYKNGKKLLVDNPLLFINPPIMVHDGTYYISKDDYGNDVDLMNYIEDPAEALKTIIIDTIKMFNK